MMNTEKLRSSLIRLDNEVRLFSGEPLLIREPLILDEIKYCFAENVDYENGFWLEMGSCPTEVFSKRNIDLVQYQYEGYSMFSERGGFAFMTWNDLSPIYMIDDGSIYASFVGGDNSFFFGKDMVDFIDNLSDCMHLRSAKYKERDYSRKDLRSDARRIMSTKDIDLDGWMYYFYDERSPAKEEKK